MMQPVDTRLEELLAHLRRSPHGLTSTELAEALGVDGSTIRRDMAKLLGADVGVRRRGRRYTVDFHQAQRPLRLTSDEVLALYLACRLLTREQSVRNPHAESVMRKLADAVRDDAPRLARYIEDAALLSRVLPARGDVLAALETLTQSLSEGRVVVLRYRDQQRTVSERRFHPYALEPYDETNSCYAIGFDELRGAIRTFRLDRIETVVLTSDVFEIPPQFDPSRLFSEAWGVMWHESPPQSVTLRFYGEAARAVQEAFWHPSQRVAPQLDGSCMVTFSVSEPNELQRWILQWGGEVEVLAPATLRARLAQQTADAASRYQHSTKGPEMGAPP
jgi:predicted DNA-binding transcriptional regulator YafY